MFLVRSFNKKKKKLKIIHIYNKINFYKGKTNWESIFFWWTFRSIISSSDETSLILILYFKYVWTYKTYHTMHKNMPIVLTASFTKLYNNINSAKKGSCVYNLKNKTKNKRTRLSDMSSHFCAALNKTYARLINIILLLKFTQ